MDEEVQRKVYWIIMAIIIGVVGILFAFVGPYMVLNYMYEINDDGVFLVDIPILANWFIGFATFFLIVFCILMTFDQKTFKLLGVLGLLIGLFLGYGGFSYFNLYTEEGITERRIVTSDSFEWQEVDAAVFERVGTSETTTMYFTLEDGNTKEYTLTRYNTRDINSVKSILGSHNVTVEEREL